MDLLTIRFLEQSMKSTKFQNVLILEIFTVPVMLRLCSQNVPGT